MTSALFMYPLILTQRLLDMPLPTENSIHIPASPLFTVPDHLHLTCPVCSCWRIYDYPPWHASHRIHLTRFAYPSDGISLELGQSFCFLFLVPHAMCVGIEGLQAWFIAAVTSWSQLEHLTSTLSLIFWCTILLLPLSKLFFSHSPFQSSLKV